MLQVLAVLELFQDPAHAVVWVTRLTTGREQLLHGEKLFGALVLGLVDHSERALSQDPTEGQVAVTPFYFHIGCICNLLHSYIIFICVVKPLLKNPTT